MNLQSIKRGIVRAATRAYPLVKGCGRLAETRPLKALMDGTPDSMVVRLKSGPMIEIVTTDMIGRSVYFFGDYDPRITWICQKLLRTGDTALDIGAHWGSVAIPMAAFVGRTGTVHAFEPTPHRAEMLTRSAKLNKFDHLNVHGLGLGEHEAVMQIGLNNGSILRKPDDDILVEVPIKQAGDYLSQLGIEKIRLIKIDVEGFENSIFTGAKSFFEQTPPDAIVFESNDHFYDPAAPQFIDHPLTKTLTDLGYFFLEVASTYTRIKFNRIDLQNPRPHYSHDILAVHNGLNADDILQRVGAS